VQEDKWKREQAALKEKQKAEELKKQILEEREREELDGLAHAAGIKQCVSSFDGLHNVPPDRKDRKVWQDLIYVL
jgi:hypothetical protein